MILGFKTNLYGHVTVKNVMLESNDKTTMFEGLEIVTEDCELYEVPTNHNLDDLSNEDVENFITANL